ncbi:hypothetical protein [Nocardiopsis aegyptia]|uniref:Uncharacterized protein n=1 Tax=Nocardiopsis aegyptia TaxID=220378 RepID=A0A7Z0JDJ1_9ACTN|nr:hypothetical protein [Nocardiopsis aegyptia]NYJ38087.1 hypothetical protein [Nocardiopsis aegyptia]
MSDPHRPHPPAATSPRTRTRSLLFALFLAGLLTATAAGVYALNAQRDQGGAHAPPDQDTSYPVVAPTPGQALSVRAPAVIEMADGTTVIVRAPAHTHDTGTGRAGTDTAGAPAPSVTDWMQGIGAVVAALAATTGGVLWSARRIRDRLRARRRP